mgnify:CR=1 FL=1
MIYSNITEIIGKTPILKLKDREIYAKLEGMNPGGSVKDRVALGMLQEALDQGLIDEDTTIVEPTSGNTGIGISMIAASLGLKVIIVMPETMSVERRQLMQAYGAKLVLTDGASGMKGAISKANELKETLGNVFIPSQFDNEANVRAHYQTTGPEIFESMNGKIDYFISGVGTGGTITGAGKYLKENGNTKIIAVEPKDSSVLSGEAPGPHKIQGIGAGFIPSILDTEIYDEIIRVENEDAFEASRNFAKREGFLVGISAGAALWAAYEIEKRDPTSKIVVILPDTGERYLSTPLFSTSQTD